LASAFRGCSVRDFEAPAQVRLVADWIASSGDPMGATTMGGAAGEIAGEVRQFGRGEGDDSVGAECSFDGEFARVGVPAGRQIDGDNRGGEGIDPIAQCCRDPAQRRPETRADDGVDEQIGGVQSALDFW